jgi:hypothetical protein
LKKIFCIQKFYIFVKFLFSLQYLEFKMPQSQQIPAGQSRPIPTVKGLAQVQIIHDPSDNGTARITLANGTHFDLIYPNTPSSLNFPDDYACCHNDAQSINPQPIVVDVN